MRQLIIMITIDARAWDRSLHERHELSAQVAQTQIFLLASRFKLTECCGKTSGKGWVFCSWAHATLLRTTIQLWGKTNSTHHDQRSHTTRPIQLRRRKHCTINPSSMHLRRNSPR
jgi:hypothetical protein